MTERKKYKCDICGKSIEEGHQQTYMVTVRMSGMEYNYDDGSSDWEEVYHVHNDMTNRCANNLFQLLKKN